MVNITQTGYNKLTTVLLASIPIIVILLQQLQIYIPTNYVIMFALIFGTVSQLATNKIVFDAIERVRSYVWFDYLTTSFLAIAPIILSYQEQILAQVPADMKILAIVILATISHFAGEIRIEKSEPLVPLDDTM